MRRFLLPLAVLIFGCEGRVQPHIIGRVDLGIDAAVGRDLGFVDAAPDAEPGELDAEPQDQGVDAGLDSGPDAGADASADLGMDAGADLGTDAELVDLGHDAGVDDANQGVEVGPADSGPTDADLSDVMGDAPPAVGFTMPASGAVLFGRVDVQISATDDHAVAQVELFLDRGVSLGVSASPPYVFSVDTTLLLDGNYELIAVATDSAAQTDTARRAVEIDNLGGVRPQVAVVYPVNGSEVCGTIRVQAIAGPSVASLRLLIDGVELTTATAPPFEADWDTSAVLQGVRHRVTAVATSTGGAVRRRSVWVVPSAGCDNHPTVAVPNPPPALIGAAGIRLAAEAADDVGVSAVVLSVDGVAVVTDTAAPYELVWIPSGVGDGPHVLTVSAFDTVNQPTVLGWVRTVDETPPVVSIVSPIPGLALDRRTYVARADATDANGVAEVTFTVDGVATSSAGAAPFEATVTVAASGDHDLAAVAVDAAGNQRTSSAVTLSVDLAPTITITAPAPSASVRGTVSITADATDDVGVQQVEFAVDGVALGADMVAPYAADWDTPQASQGAHTITATVTDSIGRTASASVTVTVDDAAPQVEITAPADAATVSRSVLITAAVSDDSALAMVDFIVDGSPLLSMPTPPFEATWDTCTRADGAGLIAVSARDDRGQTSSVAVTVTVGNRAVPPGLGGYGGVDSVILSWTTCGAGVTFNLYWSDQPGVTTTSSVVNLGFVDTYTHQGRAADSTGYYRVAQVDGPVIGPLSNEVELSPLGDYGAAFTGNARMLLYEVSLQGNTFDHFISAEDTTGPPSWSPTGDEIAFNFTQRVGYSSLPRVRLYNVTNRSTIFNLNGDEASWSADGAKVIAVDDGSQCFRTYRVDNGAQQCLSETGRRAVPAWDPTDSDRFAFIGDRVNFGPPTLFVRDMGATRIDVATSVQAFDWRPDGSGLIYVAAGGAGGTCLLRLATIDASSVTSTVDIADGVLCSSAVRWSPNNDDVAFWSTSSGGRGIYVVSVTGVVPVIVSSLTPLSETAGVIEALDWTPDGALIGYTTTSGINFTMNLCPAVGGVTTMPLSGSGSGEFEFRPVNP